LDKGKIDMIPVDRSKKVIQKVVFAVQTPPVPPEVQR